jgi:hypothetical protein
MTPKEKAEELITKFMEVNNIVYKIIKRKVLIHIATRNALMLVNEMLNNFLSNRTTKYGRERYQYWQNVKQEIEKR